MAIRSSRWVAPSHAWEGLDPPKFTFPTVKTLELKDFTGGLRLDVPEKSLTPNMVGDVCNIDFKKGGGFCRRKSLEEYHRQELGSKPVSLMEYRKPSGKYQEVLIDTKTTGVWWVPENSGSTSPVAIPPRNPEAKFYEGFQADGAFYLYDGFNPVVKWTSSAQVLGTAWNDSGDPQKNPITGLYEPIIDPLTGLPAEDQDGDWVFGVPEPTGGNMPIARQMLCCNGFAWAADTVEDGTRHCDRLRRSFPFIDGAGYEDWSELDYTHVGKDDQCITALVCCGGELWVFKERSIYRVDGFDSKTNLQVIEVYADVGTVGPHAVACCEDGIIFWDNHLGLLWIPKDGGGPYVKLFEALSPLITECKINASSPCIAVGCCDGRYWVSVPKVGEEENSLTYVLDPSVSETGAWTKYALGFSDFMSFNAQKGKDACLGASCDCNYVAKLDAGTEEKDQFGDMTKPIAAWICTAWLDADACFMDKEWCKAEFQVDRAGIRSKLTASQWVGHPTNYAATQAFSVSVPWFKNKLRTKPSFFPAKLPPIIREIPCAGLEPVAVGIDKDADCPTPCPFEPEDCEMFCMEMGGCTRVTKFRFDMIDFVGGQCVHKITLFFKLQEVDC